MNFLSLWYKIVSNNMGNRMTKGPILQTRMETVSLSDKYEKKSGAAFMTGVQALVRVVLEQARSDREAGHDTAGFISGYRGSPLGGLDLELWGAERYLSENNIHFKPALNEELAATAIIGTQQVGLHPGAKTDGVFSLWYGKGVGADRASDALKHASLMGTSPKGGVLVVVGDDHGAKSSATAHQCDQAMESWMMPFLYPSDFDEYLDFGLLGYAMSRYAGCYVGFKVVSETVEAGSVVALTEGLPEIVEPDDYQCPPDGLNIRFPDPQLHQEARQINQRLKAVQAFARANRIDKEIWPSKDAKIGIVTVGKAHGDFLQALEDLGLDEKESRSRGIALYKIGMPWPLEPEGIREFADGLDVLVVIEEKRNFVERQIKDVLFNMERDRRPMVLGKTDQDGQNLLSSSGQITSADVARVLVRVVQGLKDYEPAARYLAFLDQMGEAQKDWPVGMRLPHYCSGCPHSISTRVPDGSHALTGTGCHLMAAFMKRSTPGFLQMGGDGINWLGQAPFTKTKHVFQNLGDGTYFHSGSLGIRQAVAAGVNMTFKILFNDAVAMTGGQPMESAATAASIAQQVYSEGVRRIAVVYDRPENLPSKEEFPKGATFHTRDQLDAVQRELREVTGVSILLYVQPCAAQLRRKRRRGTAKGIKRRVFINLDVCEGCGDCAVQSSCPALSLVDTPKGRKRQVDQSMCNGDLICLEGLCPAMVSVEGKLTIKEKGATGSGAPKDIPLPELREYSRPFNVVITGVGGNGIITLGHILAIAAAQEGKGASTLNFTGLAQKGGGVVSHVRIARQPGIIQQPRIPFGGADLLLGGDTIMACSHESLTTLNRERSGVIANTYLQVTAEQIADGDTTYDEKAMQDVLGKRTKSGQNHFINATRLAQQLTGHSITANMFLLGYAFQLGGIPLQRESISNAIAMNKVMVAENSQAFEWGRLAAHDSATFERKAGPLVDPAPEPENLETTVEKWSEYLSEYQDATYARRYRNLVEKVRLKEIEVLPDSRELAQAVAVSYARLLSYKYEYEVARLLGDDGFADDIQNSFNGVSGISYHFAPDRFAGKDPLTGRVRKRAYGAWMTPLLKKTAKLKGLRGTSLDIFAGTPERKNERAIIGEYENLVDDMLDHLSPETHGQAIAMVRVTERIRGFGIVKQKTIEEVRQYWKKP